MISQKYINFYIPYHYSFTGKEKRVQTLLLKHDRILIPTWHVEKQGFKWLEATHLVSGRQGETRTPQGLQLFSTLLSRRGEGRSVHSVRTGVQTSFSLYNPVLASISWAVSGSIQPQVRKRRPPAPDFISLFHLKFYISAGSLRSL